MQIPATGYTALLPPGARAPARRVEAASAVDAYAATRDTRREVVAARFEGEYLRNPSARQAQGSVGPAPPIEATPAVARRALAAYAAHAGAPVERRRRVDLRV